MTRNQMLLIAGAVGIVLAVVGGWYFFVRDDAPPPFTLEDALANTIDAPSDQPTDAIDDPLPASGDDLPSTPEATDPPTAESPPVAGPAAFVIDPSAASVGYRINEELAGIGGNTAVGRTSVVSGSLTMDAATITEVTVVVDMTTLQSDDSRRDRQMQTRGLQTNQFPQAMFALDEPIVLLSPPAVGEPISASANGTLTLHGVSRSVTIQLDAQLTDASTIVVVGSTEVVLTDYDIEAPTGFSVLTVEDAGLFEFELTFRA